MKANGCTTATRFGDGCGNHGPRWETDPYQKPGALVRVTKYSADAQWRKHGTWRKDPKKRTTRLQAKLDATAHRKIIYDEPTVAIRKHRA